MSDKLPNEIFRSYASGKLLLTGEYFVLEGTKALACPCKFGQELWIQKVPSLKPQLVWKALDQHKLIWLECVFQLPSLNTVYTYLEEHPAPLLKLINFLVKKNPNIFEKGYSYFISTELEFDKKFGLGSSSTLIHNIAQWSEIDPFELLENTFGGSGYDLACANASKPIYYQLDNGVAQWEEIDYSPSFKENLYFVYLGKKQNSREGIKRFRQMVDLDKSKIDYLTKLGEAFVKAESLTDLESIIEEHEEFISKQLQLKKVKDVFFNDHKGAVKSLGAWGGDFVLMTHSGSKNDLKAYLSNKGFLHFYTFDELIKF